MSSDPLRKIYCQLTYLPVPGFLTLLLTREIQIKGPSSKPADITQPCFTNANADVIRMDNAIIAFDLTLGKLQNVV